VYYLVKELVKDFVFLFFDNLKSINFFSYLKAYKITYLQGFWKKVSTKYGQMDRENLYKIKKFCTRGP